MHHLNLLPDACRKWLMRPASAREAASRRLLDSEEIIVFEFDALSNLYQRPTTVSFSELKRDASATFDRRLTEQEAKTRLI